MDDYIDYYYETAMEAERDYDDFIEEALDLHKELKEMDNIVWKNYRELLTWRISFIVCYQLTWIVNSLIVTEF